MQSRLQKPIENVTKIPNLPLLVKVQIQFGRVEFYPVCGRLNYQNNLPEQRMVIPFPALKSLNSIFSFSLISNIFSKFMMIQNLQGLIFL
jgi:hypothetical protein